MLVGEDDVHLVGAHSEPLSEAVPHRLPRRGWDEAAPSDVERVSVALCESRRVCAQHLPTTHLAAHDHVVASPGVVGAAPVGGECATEVGERCDSHLYPGDTPCSMLTLMPTHYISSPAPRRHACASRPRRPQEPS